jgi:hypothetical protein
MIGDECDRKDDLNSKQWGAKASRLRKRMLGALIQKLKADC